MYVGGLPAWYETKLSLLALPSVVFEPRFGGAVRNLVYADEPEAPPRRQEVMAYKVGIVGMNENKRITVPSEGNSVNSKYCATFTTVLNSMRVKST